MIQRLLAALTVLLVHTAAAQAQQSPPAPASPSSSPTHGFPPPYAPPPGFVPPAASPPPPPTYGPPPTYAAPSYSYPPSYYQPYYPPARQRLDRPLTLGGGLGFGGVAFRDSAGNERGDNGMAYTLRLGFGLRPGLILMWDFEGALVTNVHGRTSQNANLAALQIFLGQRFFIKGGFGLAQVVENGFPTRWGGAGMLGLGYELVQGWNWSLALEATVTGARYNYTDGYDTWTNWSLVNFVVSFF